MQAVMPFEADGARHGKDAIGVLEESYLPRNIGRWVSWHGGKDFSERLVLIEFRLPRFPRHCLDHS